MFIGRPSGTCTVSVTTVKIRLPDKYFGMFLAYSQDQYGISPHTKHLQQLSIQRKMIVILLLIKKMISLILFQMIVYLLMVIKMVLSKWKHLLYQQMFQFFLIVFIMVILQSQFHKENHSKIPNLI